jgi:hypothetical protein
MMLPVTGLQRLGRSFCEDIVGLVGSDGGRKTDDGFKAT